MHLVLLMMGPHIQGFSEVKKSKAHAENESQVGWTRLFEFICLSRVEGSPEAGKKISHL